MKEKEGTSGRADALIILPLGALFVSISEIFDAHAQLGF